MEGLTIRVHATLRDAEADLEAPGLAGYAFGRHAWLRAWHDTMGASAGVVPAIVVLADARVRMVLPLGIRRSKGVRVLEFLGGTVTDYNAPLADPAFAASLDASSVQALWTRIGAVLPPHDIVRLVRMPASLDAPGGAGEAQVPNPLVHLPGASAAGLARSVALPDSYAALAASLRRKFRQDTIRCRRLLENEGSVRLLVADDDATMRTVIAAVKPMKSRRWTDTGSRDWFANADFADFYDAMGGMTLPEGRVHGSALTVGDTLVAAHLGLVYRDRFYLLLVGWKSDGWQRFSTGRLIIDALMQATIDDGLRVFDFTVGDEAYKREWVDTELPLFACERAVGARGHWVLTATALIDRLRARAKRVAWLRGAVRRLAGRPRLPGRK